MINTVYAADTSKYELLEGIAGLKSVETIGANKFEYFVGIYNTALTLVIALALVMIVVGGVQYTISWASPSAKEEAKGRILGAIGGLILALLSVLILSTINPALVNPTIDLSGVSSTGSHSDSGGDGEGGGYVPRSDHRTTGGMTDQAARDFIENQGNMRVGLRSCYGNPSPCSDFEGVLSSTMDYSKFIADDLNRQISGRGKLVVNDATGPNHSGAGHYDGMKVDFDDTAGLNDYVYDLTRRGVFEDTRTTTRE